VDTPLVGPPRLGGAVGPLAGRIGPYGAGLLSNDPRSPRITREDVTVRGPPVRAGVEPAQILPSYGAVSDQPVTRAENPSAPGGLSESMKTSRGFGPLTFGSRYV
jgi:hypothetical protein